MIKPEDIKGDDERSEQMRLFVWASSARPQYPQLKWLHAIPNANSHRQVAEGVRAGVADIFLPYPKLKIIRGDISRFCGLYIELKLPKRFKEKNGGLSQAQIDFGRYANSVGYLWYACYGWEQTRDRIVEYLK
jgi:hypothetical protein